MSESVPPAASLSMTVVATSGSLARLLAVVHQRGAYVQNLSWVAPRRNHAGHAQALLTVECDHNRAKVLRASLARLVDVLDVRDPTAGPDDGYEGGGIPMSGGETPAR